VQKEPLFVNYLAFGLAKIFSVLAEQNRIKWEIS